MVFFSLLEMYKPRPEPRHIPEYNREEKMTRRVPEPEINDREDVFDDEEEEEEEEPINRKSRMERMHAVPTPLAAVMKKDPIENNNLEHHRRRRSFEEEAEEQPPLDDSMVCTHRLYHSLEYTNAYTNPGKTRATEDTNENQSNVSLSPHSLLTKTNLKQQRGCWHIGNESSKKVSFDEESLRSTSSHYSRSDGELWPQKLSLPHGRRYQKKRTSSQTSVDSPVAVRSYVTTSPWKPYQVKQEIKRHLIAKDLNFSLDEGFSDTFETNVAKRNNGRSTSYTHSSKSDSFDGSIYKAEESDTAPRNPFHLKTSSLDRSLYHYSSSDSEDCSSPTKSGDKKVNPRSTFTRQVGRRGRKKAQVVHDTKPVPAGKDNSEFVIQELELEPGGRSQRQFTPSPRNLSKNYRVAPREETWEKTAFSDESFSNHSHSSNYINNEAILLEKYIIRKPKSESSSSVLDNEMLDDSIIHSNLGGNPDELALHDSFEYYGFAAGPKSTSSTDNILNERESIHEQHASPRNPEISIKEISNTFPEKAVSFDITLQTSKPMKKILNTYSEKAVSVDAEPLKEKPGENAERLVNKGGNTNDALTMSMASILSLSSEEGSVMVNDFLQDYDHEPCVRRARSMTLGHEDRISAGISSLESKKVRFCSEDNLVYELRYGFSDEDKPSESPEKLDLSFVDDIQSDEQLSDSAVSPNTPSLPRYFHDSDGSSSSCTPDSSPRLLQCMDPAEQSTSHRTLLRKSLQMPTEKDTITDQKQTSGLDNVMMEDWSALNDVTLKEQRKDMKDTGVDDTKREKDFSEVDHEHEENFSLEVHISPQSQGSSDVSNENQTPPLSRTNRDREMVLDGESKIELDEKRKVDSGELTPLQPWKKGDMWVGSSVCRSLFKDSGNLSTESHNTSETTSIKMWCENNSEGPSPWGPVLVTAFTDTDNEKGKAGSKLDCSKEQNLRVDTKEEGDQYVSFVPLTSPLQSSAHISYIDTQSQMVPSAVPSSSSTLFVSSTIQSHDNSASEEVLLVTTSVAVTTQTPSGISVQSNDFYMNDTPTCVPVPVVSAVVTSSVISTSVQSPGNSSFHSSSEDVTISKSAETQRAPTFIAFHSTPVDKPYIATKPCVHDKTTSAEISTQGIAISTKHCSNSGHTTLITTSSILHTSVVSSSSSVINSSPGTGSFSQSAFSDWNRKPTPVKPLTFIPPKTKKSLTNTSPLLVEGKTSTSQTSEGELSHLKKNLLTGSKESCSERQDGKQTAPKDSYNSTAEWVLSHSKRFVFRSGELEKQSNEDENMKSLTNAVNKKESEISSRIYTEMSGDSRSIGDDMQGKHRIMDDGKQARLSSPTNRKDKCEFPKKQLKMEERRKGDAFDGKINVKLDEKQNENLKTVESKESDIDTEKQEAKSCVPQLQENEQDKSVTSDFDEISESHTSGVPIKSFLDYQRPMDNAAVCIEGIESNSNTSSGGTREPYGYFRDVNRPLWKHPSEFISVRQYRESPKKKKVYIDGSLQRSRVSEAETDEQDSGKVAVQSMDPAANFDNGRKRENAGTPLIGNHGETVISTEVFNATEDTVEQKVVEELHDKDSKMGGIVDTIVARDIKNTDNNMACIRRKKEKLNTADVETYGELPPLCDSKNSDLGENLTEEKSANQPENDVMKFKSGARREDSQSLRYPKRKEVPSMLPRTLSAKRLSSMIARPESPEAVHILSEIFLAILIFLVSMLFLFY